MCKWLLKKKGEAGDPGPFACDDGDPCTTGDTCEGKACKAAATTCKCQSNADCANVDDGNLCNGTFFCDKSLKVADCVFNPASVVHCSKKDDTECLKQECDPKTGACGLQPVKGAPQCDDGDPCTGAGACDGGACKAGSKLDCSDGDPCTQEKCDPKGGCVKLGAVCDDGNECTSDACDKKTGKCSFSHASSAVACNADNDGCTVNDHCQAGVCAAGSAVVCSLMTGDCEVPLCVSTGATGFQCVVAPKKDGVACPDGKGACLLGATCKSGRCKAGTKPSAFTSHLADGSEDVWLRSIAPLGSDRFLAAGGRTVGDPKTSNDRRWWTVGVDRFGSLLWKLEDKPKAASKAHVAHAVCPGPGGVARVVGVGERASGKHGALRIVTVAADGKIAGAWTREIGWDAVWIGDAVATQDGGLVAAVQFVTNDPSKPYSEWVRLDGTGKQLAAYPAEVSAPRVALTGQWLHPWSRSNSAPNDIRLVHGALNVDTLKGSLVITSKPGRKAYVTVGMPNGGFLALFAEGALGMRATAAWPDGKEAYDAPLADLRWQPHGATVSGKGLRWVGQDDGKHAAAGAMDALGNHSWQKTWTVGDASTLTGIVAVDADHSLAVGSSTTGGKRRPLLIGIGPFGANSCDGAGKCGFLRESDCDDGKDCTQDVCDPASGCTHVATVSRGCTPSSGCSVYGPCEAGQCKDAHDGVMRHLPISWTGTHYGHFGAFFNDAQGNLAGAWIKPQTSLLRMKSESEGYIFIDSGSACPQAARRCLT